MVEGLEPTEVSLEKTGIIDLPRVDVTEYIGKKAEIEFVTEHKGNYGHFVKFVTKAMGSLKDEKKQIVTDKEGLPVLATGSLIIGLNEDKDGNIGWGKDSKMSRFLAKYGVDHYKKMKGKEVLVQGRDSDGKTFLTIA